jgi:hypothetical protein
VSRWNVLNTEYPSNSSVDETGKLSIQEALSVTRKRKAVNFVYKLSDSFSERKVFYGKIVCPSVFTSMIT